MKKKLFSVMLLIMSLMLIFNAAAIELESVETVVEAAVNEAGAGTLAAESTITGSGTASDPYIIDEAADFIEFTNAINAKTNYSGVYFRQEADIDLSANTDYVGTNGAGSSYKFSGVYDGNGHTINVAIDTTGNNTVFPYTHGTVMNLGITGFITNTGYGSGMARSVRGGAKLVNCYSTADITCSGAAGGLTASNYGTIENCYFGGTITTTGNKYAISQSSNSGHVYTNNYFLSGCGATYGEPNKYTTNTAVTEENITVTLADLLNAGRENAATTLGVETEAVYFWTTENGYIDQHLYVDPGITGTGTKADPFVIDSSSDFALFSSNVNSGTKYSGQYIVQEVDVDLSSTSSYTGTTAKNTFAGIYNGKGHTINVAIDNEGLENTVFPYVTGTIMNVGITGSISGGGSYVAGFARSIRNGAKIVNCYSVANVTNKDSGNVYGISASLYGTMDNCYFAGTLTGGGKNTTAPYAANGEKIANRTYYVAISGANNNADTIEVTAEEATTTLANLLNTGRSQAAATLGVITKEVYNWTNEAGLPKHFVPVYDNVTVTQTASYVAASGSAVTFSAEADYIAEWRVDVGNTDVTYTVSDDLQSVTVTPGKLAGVVTVSVYAADEVLISDEYKLIIHSGKAGVPGINMLNGLDKAVDFEDGYSYGIKNMFGKSLTVGDIPEINYSASVNSSGASAEALENNSAKAIITDASSTNYVSGDGVYLIFKTAVSGLEMDRGYSVYAQIYTNSSKTYSVPAWLNNFKATDGAAGMSVTYNARTNTWKELKYTGTYAKNSTASPAVNGKFEGTDASGATTITVAALDNMYVIPHYNVTYHMPDGTENTVSFNPVISEFPLTLATVYTPEMTYEEGNYYDQEQGKYICYSGKWTTTEDGVSYNSISLENKDIHLYPEKLADGSAIFRVDSYGSMTYKSSEAVTVTDEYNSAIITGNGTAEVTVQGKGYNAILPVTNEAGETVATIYLTGNHLFRPGLNYFTGTKDGYDIETGTLFAGDVVIAENPYKSDKNSTERVLKIYSETKEFPEASLALETPIKWHRPYKVEYDIMGNTNGQYTYSMNAATSVLQTYPQTTLSTDWTHVKVAEYPHRKVNYSSQSALNSFVFRFTGVANDPSYALYIDNFSIVPAYKIEYFNEKNESIEYSFYAPAGHDAVSLYSETTYTPDYNPNANYIVNGTPVKSGESYTLAYEDLKIIVKPNDDAIMFSGTNATVTVPEGDEYVIPYAYELLGLRADYFVTWYDIDGNEVKPGTTVNTADYVGKTLYAHCDETVYTRYPLDGMTVNLAPERYNNWIANYSMGSIVKLTNWSEINEVGVTFKWDADENASSYTLLYSTNSDMSEATEVSASTSTSKKVNYLYVVTDYYWQVRTEYSDGTSKLSDVWHFKTAETVRAFSLASNLRDLGGVITEDGKYRIKQGLAFRSGISGASSNASKVLKYLGIRSELDIRGAEAGDKTVSTLGETVSVTVIEGTHSLNSETSSKHYKNPTGQERLKEEIQFFADENNYPLWFHCSAGRDRTGLLAYTIEGLLGVSEEQLYKDYELSSLSSGGANTLAAKDYLNRMVGYHDYIDTFEGETFKDKVESFCLYIGVTQDEIDSIRNILLEPSEKAKPITLKLGSMRLVGTPGMRVAGFVSNIARESSEEYGFIVALADSFPEKNYTALTHSRTDINTVVGVSYNINSGVDKIYLDARKDTSLAKSTFCEHSLEENGIYFTGVYVNMPETVKAYTSDIVCRSYVKLDGEYYYGEPTVKNLYEVALSLKELYEEKGLPTPVYAAKVIGKVEGTAE